MNTREYMIAIDKPTAGKATGFDLLFIRGTINKDWMCLPGRTDLYLKKNLNPTKPSEHPPHRGKSVKTFRWDHRLQVQNLSMHL